MSELLHTEIISSLSELSKREPWLAEHFEFSEDLIESLETFFTLLSRWTTRVDLVADSEPEQLVLKHLVDSVLGWGQALSKMKVSQQSTVLDIGSGGGLPGIVIALLSPQSKVHLLEPRAKRIQFLKEARMRLQLKNLTIHHCRIEDIDAAELHGALNVTITRAFSDEGLFLRQSARLLETGGQAIVLQGPNWKLIPGHSCIKFEQKELVFQNESPYSLIPNNHLRIIASWILESDR